MIELSTVLTDTTYGFHPSFRSTISITDQEEMTTYNCSIGLVYQNLPTELIVDKYQIRMLFEEERLVIDSVGGSSQSTGIDLHIWGHSDLEAPSSILDSQLLSGLIIPLCTQSKSDYSATVIAPFHLRYLPPIIYQKHERIPIRKLQIKPPSLFRFCNKNKIIKPLFINQFPKSISNLTNMIGSHISAHELPTTQSPNLTLLVPVGIQDHQLIVELITTIFIWIGFFWIIYCLLIDYHQQSKNKISKKKKNNN